MSTEAGPAGNEMMERLLEVSDLRTEFRTRDGTFRAVDDVSFSVEKGRTIGIVGESGSGKSVTSLSIMGLVPNPPGRVTGGKIVFNGRDLRGLSGEEMRKVRGGEIAMIFQDPMTSLNPVLTIGRQLTESLRLHLRMSKQQAVERAVEILDLVGIPSARKRLRDYPHQFSGGMRQRVMIGMAISCNPKLLIADEPTTALDVTIQAQILELIRSLQKELGMAVIIITHDLGVVAGMADEVIVMYAGRVVERAPARTLFANPRMPYTIGLLQSIPRLDDDIDRKLVPIKGSPPEAGAARTCCPFMPRCNFAVPGICDREVPPLRAVGENHNAACLFDVTLETAPGPVLADRTNPTGVPA